MDATGNVSIAEDAVNDGSSDACGGLTFDTDITSFTCSNVGANAVVLTVTDINGNSSTANAVVTVEDKIAPTFSCSASVARVFDLNQIYYTISNSEFNVTPIDNCSIATLIYTLSGATIGSGSNSLTGVQLNEGLTKILWQSADVSGNVFECYFNVTVNKRPTIIVYTGDLTEEYSDQQTLKAILKDQHTNTPLSEKTVGFTIGSQSVSDGPGLPNNGTDGSGVAEANLALAQAPGNYNVISSFAGDATYLPSSNISDPFTISKENTDVTYTGLPYFSTTSATSCNATVTLSATIKDITALGGGDTNAGDIRNAKVTFRLGNPMTGMILGTSNIPVVLVSAGNTMIGTVSTTFNYTLSSTDCANKGVTLDIYAVVNNYYKGDNCLDPGSVTISVPGSESVTGGGFLKMQNSIGTYAGTTGTKTNFGFTMKWTKTGTNVKGQANIIIRRNGRVYQIKSNAISSLSVSGSSGNFVTKANMKDITDPLNPVTIGGNSDLYVNMYDGSTGGQLDEISILYQSGSTIIYSSHWNGTATVRRLLDGGNVQVRTGVLTAKEEETAQSSDTKQKVEVIAVSKETVEPIQATTFNVIAYPNPSAHYFSLDVIGGSNEKVEIDIFDMHGRSIKHIESADHQSIMFGEDLPSGGYFAIINQGANRKTLKLVKK
ncbi:hypothetical protein DB891_14670 [Flavobacterium laiguense]|uniref:Secretion system C-terminal sorting domain-containing protein n=1 Tax=Flavobacterium laiguense TaxID=2169409 RepID=A0A2U1JR16_9FLAO|nr:hypothetical protein DB891_14670 [Flavobacterium laiguense]